MDGHSGPTLPPGDRYDKFIGSYGGDYNKIPSNADNYKFLMGELLTGNGGFIKKGRGTSGSWEEFKKKTNISNATVDFRKTWERAGVAHDGPRIEYAKKFLSALPPETGKTTATSTPPEKKQLGGMVGTKMMSPNVTNNVTNKNLREEPKQLGGMVGTKMMSPNVTNNVTNNKQLGGMVGTKMMSPNVTNNVTNNKQLGGMVGTKMMSPNVTNNVTNNKQLGGMVENKTNYMSNLSNATVDSRKTDGPRIEYAKKFLSTLPPETEKTTATPPEKKQLGGMVGTNTTNMMGSNTSKVNNMMGSKIMNNTNMMGSNTSKVNNMMGSNTSKVMNEINNMVSKTVEKKQTGGMVGNNTKYMSNASNKSQEFRQANMKQMSQSAQSGSPIVIMNNNSQQSSPVMMPPGDAYVPSLPDAPSNDIWKSYINFAQRMSIG